MTTAALAITVGAESAVLIGGSRLVGLAGLVLVLIATAAWALVVSDTRAEPSVRLVVIAIAVAFAIGLAVPPRNSHDLWSYVMYGRIVSVHHASPYVHLPREFRADPFLGRVGAGWRHMLSVYGPLFTGMSAGLTRMAGTSALRARLAFQGLATLGVVAALGLVWRSTRSARALAFLGLHPVVVMAIVNGGHNDSLVGLALLGGALLVGRRHWYGAGFVLGLGILVKASTGLGLLGIAAWSATRDRGGATRLLGAAGATALVGYLPVGLVSVRATAHAGNGNTRGSVWDLISTVTHSNATIALIVVLALVVLVAYRLRTADRPETAALATTAAYLIAGAYVLPWYPAWGMPLAAVERRSRLAMLVGLQAAFLVAVYEFELPAHPTLTGAWGVIRTGAIQIGAWTALVAFLILAIAGRAPVLRRPARS